MLTQRITEDQGSIKDHRGDQGNDEYLDIDNEIDLIADGLTLNINKKKRDSKTKKEKKEPKPKKEGKSRFSRRRPQTIKVGKILEGPVTQSHHGLDLSLSWLEQSQNENLETTITPSSALTSKTGKYLDLII